MHSPHFIYYKTNDNFGCQGQEMDDELKGDSLVITPKGVPLINNAKKAKTILKKKYEK